MMPGSRSDKPRVDSRSTRRGVTIVEMLMVISILAVILGACVIQIQLLMKLDQAGRLRIEESSAWARLARQLRRDVHEAETAEPFSDKKTTGLRIRKADEADVDQVEYRVEPRQVVRIGSKQGKAVTREAFATPRAASAEFVVRNEDSRQFVVLSLIRSSGSAPDAPTIAQEIVALIGMDRIRAVPSGERTNP